MFPNPQALSQAALDHYVHSNTDLDKHRQTGSMLMVEGDGVRVKDAQGRSYIEGVAALWCAGLGFNEPRLADAAARQMRRLSYYHNFAAKSADVPVALAERLAEMAPGDLNRVMFATSGSEANDTAVKLAWYYHNALGQPAKKKIIARRQAYHGVTVASGSMTQLAAINGGFDLPIDRFIHTDCPHYWRFAEPGESEADYATRLADSLERLILAEGPETIAAMIAEPMMGVGGVLFPPETYFPKIQSVLHKYDILLIADEVICGFGRLGTMFGSTYFGVTPDIMTLGKQITSAAFPLSAILMTDRVFDVIAAESGRRGTFGHGYTYAGHPVGAAVAMEVLDIYQERDILSHVRRMGRVLHDRLAALADHPLVGEVRGDGLVAAVQLVDDKAARCFFDPAQGVAKGVAAHLQENGVILRVLSNDSIAIAPPLIIGEHDLTLLLDRLESSLNWAARNLGRM
ncbi:aminotransferase [Niveispirillum cyanobacteriorum]|uniref:Aspartate aminotransferase family protein n=1 Tax=Niveispirillum cyanobacteriorum TaxID=1612173 RepID=A0A2K9NA39_9PROT|nr:aminotransferase [Niveispirillum cyanobacteriorum]AUN29035.1 aspartate aminotransferase family protein [Niveispirillum cyanobacteriorum]GGE68171.1 aspartate aminotransferase family protein [Niveispirillum cyanobacteriorum]